MSNAVMTPGGEGSPGRRPFLYAGKHRDFFELTSREAGAINRVVFYSVLSIAVIVFASFI